MKIKSKRYKKDLAKFDVKKRYTISEAVSIIKGFNTTKFDQTVNMAIKLRIDPKKTEHQVRGTVALPKGIGKTRKVIVFADGDEAKIAKEMGADEIGGEELVKKVQDGWTDFDVAITIPRMMKSVGKLGKVLGPQGKMPSPKSGTVTEDVKTAVKEFKAGKLEFRTDAGGNVHAPVGKISFSEQDLKENAAAFLEHIKQAKPAGVKGGFIQNAVLSASMSPGVKLALVAEKTE